MARMEPYTIDMIEPTPTPDTLTCKAYVWLITVALKGAAALVALFVWWRYDAVMAFFALLVGYVVMGIVRSKLRTYAIPPKQFEQPYSDYAIACWVAMRRLC